MSIYRRKLMVIVSGKVVLRCVNAYPTVFIETVCVFANIPLFQISADEWEKVYGVTKRLTPKNSQDALQAK